jgi:predicted GNAT family acetyltransferase
MDFKHESGRYYIEGENGELLAEIVYPRIDDGKNVVIDRTYVDPSLRGQGIAGKLLKLVVDEARRDKFLIEPLCTFAAGEFQRRPEYADVLRPTK